MVMTENFLVSSSSRKNPLIERAKSAIQRVTNGLVVAGDHNPLVEHLTSADLFWQMPRTTDENFDEIASGCMARDIKFVLPSRDSELEFWASRKRDFGDLGIHVVVSDSEAIKICADKLLFYEQLKGTSDVGVTPTFESPFDVPSQDLVVKERFGAGSKNVLVGIPKSEAEERSEGLSSPIFQPMLTGREISVDAHFSMSGKFAGCVLRDRVLVIDGESHITRTFSSATIGQRIEGFLSNMASQHDFFGPIVLQAFVGFDESVTVLEINPRFGGASALSVEIGLDTLYWSLAELKNDSPASALSFVRQPRELELRRLVKDSFAEVLV